MYAVNERVVLREELRRPGQQGRGKVIQVDKSPVPLQVEFPWGIGWYRASELAPVPKRRSAIASTPN